MSEEAAEEEFTIEALLDRRFSQRSGCIEYLVTWTGYHRDEDSWEPASELPLDMRQEFDDARRVSSRPKRSTR